MITRERGDAGNKETEGQCHYLFDVIGRKDPRGGYTSAYGLQAESIDQVPSDAKNVRPVWEGDEVGRTYDLSNPQDPTPVRKIHIHARQDSRRSCFGFPWGGVREEALSDIEARVFKLQNPIIWD